MAFARQSVDMSLIETVSTKFIGIEFFILHISSFMVKSTSVDSRRMKNGQPLGCSAQGQ